VDVAGYRVRFTKLGRIRFTSQRDVARMWERALRRSGLPVAWSVGFSPRPLLSFGLALPTGCESLAEYLDIRLSAAPERGDFDPRALGGLLPEGIEVVAVTSLTDGAESLQQEVTSCSWELEVLGVTHGELTERIGQALDAPSILVRRERKGRLVEDDLRPSVLALTPRGGRGAGSAEDGRLWIDAELATRPRGVRPSELLKGLGADVVLARACRTNQWIECDGTRREPLPVDGETLGTVGPHATERAS
jgi:radical SAM-linked protein